MKTQEIMLGIVALATIFSGCTVKCHFDKYFQVKGQLYEEDCIGKIDICPPNTSGCDSKMRIECGGQEVYDGPYTVQIQNNKIKYIATDFQGDPEDAPRIVSKEPQNSGDTVDAFEVDNDWRGEGSCTYSAPALNPVNLR